MPFPLSNDRRIVRFFEYWDSLREPGCIPSQRVFDPVEIGPLLRNTWMARWSQEDQDFVYRLAGENILAASHHPMRHKPLSKIFDSGHAESVRHRYQVICATPLLHYSQGQIYSHIDRYGTGERLVLPLQDRDGRTTTVLGCTVYSGTDWPQDRSRPGQSQAPEISTFLTLDAEPTEAIREAC